MEYKFINPEYIESIAGGDKDTIRELVDLFREQVVEFRLEMNTLLENRDYYNLGLLAHKAKSSIAIIGMADLAIMLKTFELDAKESRNVESYATWIARFESDTVKAIDELNEYVSNL